MAQVASVLANMFSKGRTYKVADFFPRWDRESSAVPAQQDPEQMIAVFRGLLSRKKRRKGASRG